MSAQHTPGPWRLDDPEQFHPGIGSLYHYIESGEGFCGDGDKGFCLSGCMSLADARLIAAAPTMLDALIAVEQAQRDGNYESAFKAVSAAIKSAVQS